MKPQAYEALQKAKALFRHPAEVDEIPADAKPVEPIRKPRVVLLPPNAPKFDKESMKQEHKQAQQTDKYVEMSVVEAVQTCLSKGIKRPADIVKETGKNVNQVYTALWKIKQRKKKTRAEAKEAKKQMPTPKQQADEWNKLARKLPTIEEVWDREPTPFEEAHMVVMRNRADYESIIENLNQRISELLLEKQELNTIIKYLEKKNG